jgi:hypothetical protein
MKFLIALALAALIAVPALGQTTTMPTTYTWTAPTTGSAVTHYVVQGSTDGGVTWSMVTQTPNATPQITLALAVGVTWVVRVAGVDAQARQGVFSQHSDPYTPDAGAPGAPGKPIQIP